MLKINSKIRLTIDNMNCFSHVSSNQVVYFPLILYAVCHNFIISFINEDLCNNVKILL